MKGNYSALYEKQHLLKEDERLGLFQRLKDRYPINKVLYPGSYAHITPIFIFPVVVFNDVYKKLEPFYDSDEIYAYINKRKIYPEEPSYSYINADYTRHLPCEDEEFDLLISQYAGFISRACKRYLKIGGKLVVNNSHGDASMASISPDYELIAVIHKRGMKYSITTKGLEDYFVPKKKREITEEFLEIHRRGIGYNKVASNYVFKKIK